MRLQVQKSAKSPLASSMPQARVLKAAKSSQQEILKKSNELFCRFHGPEWPISKEPCIQVFALQQNFQNSKSSDQALKGLCKLLTLSLKIWYLTIWNLFRTMISKLINKKLWLLVILHCSKMLVTYRKKGGINFPESLRHNLVQLIILLKNKGVMFLINKFYK